MEKKKKKKKKRKKTSFVDSAIFFLFSSSFIGKKREGMCIVVWREKEFASILDVLERETTLLTS